MTGLLDRAAPPEVGILSLHDALPISAGRATRPPEGRRRRRRRGRAPPGRRRSGRRDRKSTRLNSSHRTISYAVFCLKKKSDESKAGVRLEHADQPLTTTRLHEWASGV